MMFKVTNYELKVNSRKQIENICVYITNIAHEYYLDIANTDNLPLSKLDKNNIIELRCMINMYREGKSSILDVIANLKKLKNNSKFLHDT